MTHALPIIVAILVILWPFAHVLDDLGGLLKRLAFVAALFGSSSLSATTTTFTANLNTLLGESANAYVHLEMQGCSTYVPRTGTAVYTKSLDLYPNGAAGLLTYNVQDQATFTCGTSTGTVYYTVSVCARGSNCPQAALFSGDYDITGASFNLNTSAPRVTADIPPTNGIAVLGTMVGGKCMHSIDPTHIGETAGDCATNSDASPSVKGIVQLAGDLGGTAALPTVPGLAAKAPLASPTFTGTPAAPTPVGSDNSTTIATTAYVKGQSYVTATTAPVVSAFGRTGAVVAAASDYSFSQISGAATLAQLPFGTANQILGTNSGATAIEQKTLSTGTSGTDFAIAHSAGGIAFNLPDASATARGLITTGSQTIAGSKTWTAAQLHAAAVSPSVAGAQTIGTNALPWSSLYIGAAATNNIQLTGTATSAKVATFPDNTGTVAELNLAQTWTAAQTLSNTLNWTTGLGAINHILGPTDQPLAIVAGQTNGNVQITPNGTGSIVVPNGTAANPSIIFPNGATTGYFSSVANTASISASGVESYRFGAVRQTIHQSNGLSWGSSGMSTPDVGLSRLAAGVLLVDTSTVGNGSGFIKSANTQRVAADFTTAANTNLQTITGLSWTLPNTGTLTFSFECNLTYSQATANAAVAFGIQAATNAPTAINASGQLGTSLTAFTTGTLRALATTTATNIVSATPSAFGALGTAADMFLTHLWGTIENPATTANTINIMVSTATSGDAVTVYRGSACYFTP